MYDRNDCRYLGEDEVIIRNIVEIAQKYAPEYDIEKILKELLENT